jgi:phage terminase small subunit
VSASDAAKARGNGASAQPPANSPGGAGERPATGTAGIGELEERFAREYAVDLNATQAYLRIRPNVKEASARVEGCKLLAKPNVQELIARLKREQFARLEITADKVLRELALVAFSDVGHYQVDPATGRLTIVEGELPERRRAVQTVKHRTVHTGEGDRARVEYYTELRLWDKLGALVKLGEHLRLFKPDEGAKGRTEVILDADGSVRIITAGDA